MRKLYLVFSICTLISCVKEQFSVFDENISYSSNCSECDSSKIFCFKNNQTEANLIADGKSLVNLIVCLPINASEKIKEVIFESPSDAGDFSIEGGTNNITKQIGNEKFCSVIFKTGVKPGIYTIKAKVKLDSIEYVESIIITINPIKNSVLNLTLDRDVKQLKADSTTLIKAKIILLNFSSKSKKIECSIIGDAIKIFKSDTTIIASDINDQNEVTFNFQTTYSSGPVKLSFKHEGFEIDTSFFINYSYPDKMKIVHNFDSIGINQSIPIDIYMAKYTSSAFSKFIPVEVKAFQIIDGKTIDYSQSLPPIFNTTNNNNDKPVISFNYMSPASPIWDKSKELFISCNIPNTTISDVIMFKIK